MVSSHPSQLFITSPLIFHPTQFTLKSSSIKTKSPRNNPHKLFKMVTTSNPSTNRGFELYRPQQTICSTGPLTPDQIDEFFDKGVVIARNLLSQSMIQQIHKAHQESTSSINAATYEALNFGMYQQFPILNEIATTSAISQAVAQLTPFQPSIKKGRELVVIRDALFLLKGKKQGCYFHVDDKFFWPSPQDQPGPGVNIWIACDAVGKDGGGLAVAPGSHKIDYIDCRDAIENQTCAMRNVAPALADRLEEIAYAPIMQPGDVIFMTRYMFHRADPFVKDSIGEKGPGVLRYSLRYMPGNALVQEIDVSSQDGKLNFKPRPACTLMDADPERYPAAKL